MLPLLVRKRCNQESDSKKRQPVKKKLELCNDPLKKGRHSDSLVNIETEIAISHSAINVDNAVAIGKALMQEFKENWPEGFNKPLSPKIKALASSQKHIKVSNATVYDAEVIYAWAMVLKQTKNFDMDSLLAHEPAALPHPMFKETGKIRDAMTKSNLKNAVKVKVPGRVFQAKTYLWLGVPYFG